MIIRKGFKFRIYPTVEQQRKLAVQFGQARYVYNYYLNLRNQTYTETGKGMGYCACANHLTHLKREAEHEWLRDGDSQVLQQALKDLQAAFDNFFRKLKSNALAKGKPRKDGRPSGFPRFRSKHGRQSIRYPQRFKVKGDRIYLAKVGWVRVVRHREMMGQMKSCTVSRTKSGRFFISILCEIESPDTEPSDKPTVGVDLGLLDFVVTSDGEHVPHPKHLRRAERRLRIRQKRLSRKKKGSRNRQKARHRVAVQHEKVADQRRDFHHKLSHSLVSRYGRIVFEDLNVAGMLKTHRLARSIADAGWAQFVRFCAYKMDWAGGTVDKAERFFPSTKTCSVCGEIADSLTLSDRTWNCISCGSLHDRDENAATNLLNYDTGGAPEIYASGYMKVVRPSAQEAHTL